MIIQTLKKENYRPEIDGLRAFAVITVIINHFNKDFFPSGYLGVDIFFVISGYVITSSFARRRTANFWDFICNFYEKRIKRIIPALVFFVVIMSIFICFFNYNPRKSLRTGLSALFGLSNFTLLRLSTEYFEQSTQLNVFMHTWSLGVEEQFYFLFPLIAWFTGFARQTIKGYKIFFTLIFFLATCSLISFIYFYPLNQSLSYFLMPNRFWEIAVGCILFLSLRKRSKIICRLEKISPIGIFTAIIGAMFLPISFGIGATISIVFLSAILLSCLREGSLLYKYFTNKYVTHIGLISYSLYLWHWGVISISRWTIGIHWWTIPFQIILIYFLALASYRWIETPMRIKNWSLKKIITLTKGIFLILLPAVFLIALDKPLKGKLYLGKSELNVQPPKFKALDIDRNCHGMLFKNEYSHKEVFNKCLSTNENKKQTFLFLGDSHNRSLWEGAEYISQQTNSNILSFSYGGITFPAIKSYRITNKEEDLKNFLIIKSFEEEILSDLKEGDLVFINLRQPYHFGEDWYDYPIKMFRYFDENDQEVLRNSKHEYFKEWLTSLKKFAEKLSKKNVKIIISSPTPEFPEVTDKMCRQYRPQWFNRFSQIDCSFEKPIEFFNSVNGKYSKIIPRLQQISQEQENIYLFDALSIMCPNSLCRYSLDGKPLYFDDDHISNYAARYIMAPAILNFLKEKKILSKTNLNNVNF